jgi:malonate-semialdehyde dehydrogenase (acetylating)/methylmalonate-semialdehyde dehydrogenase
MFGVAIACGNAFILKPSERDPSVPVRLAELMLEAGLPDGVLNVVHGDKEMVDAILDEPTSRRSASSDRPTSRNISTAAAPRTAKRCRRSAAPRITASSCRTRTSIWSSTISPGRLRLGRRALHGAAGGCAGRRQDREQPAREADPRDRGAARRRLDRCGGALRPGRHQAHKERIESYIQMCVDEGGELVVDGRGFKLQGHEEGFFIGPTFFDHVKPSFRSYQEEIFGPVLQMVAPTASRKRSASPPITNMATASPSSPATATPPASSRRASMSAWSA